MRDDRFALTEQASEDARPAHLVLVRSETDLGLRGELRNHANPMNGGPPGADRMALGNAVRR